MNHRPSKGTVSWLLGIVVGLSSLAGCGDDGAQWTSAGALLEARSFHSATLLEDDSVLFAGGVNDGAFAERVELRSTMTGRWTVGPSLITARARHAAVRLADGRVVLVGGESAAGPLASVEAYDPKTEQLSSLAPMAAPRTGHTASHVASLGEWIVVAGGSGPGEVSGTAMRYDVQAGKWIAPENMRAARSAHTATWLDAAGLVVLGGADGTSVHASVERYDASMNEWREAGELGEARSEHTATRLDEATILVVGGRGAGGVLGSAEEYHYDDEAPRSAAVGRLRIARRGHTATRLDDGTVLVVGGVGEDGEPVASVERYNPATQTFEDVPSMSEPRAGHTTTWLADGSVLVAGGGAQTIVEQFVPDDTRPICERTADCPAAMICNAEKRCEHPAGTLGAEGACAITGAPLPTGSGVFFAFVASMLAALGRRGARRSTRKAAALSLFVLAFAPGAAEAQDSMFYLDRLPLAGGPEDGMAVWRPVFGRTGLFGQVAFGHAWRPLRVESFVHDPERASALVGPAVARQLTGYLTLGAEVMRRGSIQVSVPYIVSQRGYPTDEREVGLTQSVAPSPSALGDLRVDGRMLIAWNASRSFSLAARGALVLPTGDSTSFAGERGAWAQAGVSAEYDARAFFLTANAGITVRPKSTLVDLTVGTELAYAFGAYLPLMHDRVRLGAEIFGTAGLLPEASGGPEGLPVEVAFLSRMTLGAQRRVFLGLGGGTRLGAGYAPDARFVVRIGGVLPLERVVIEPHPEVRVVPEVDSDGDGLVDGDDMCPNAPEDHKRAEDGCPETDEDGDGIDSSIDACPTVAEDADGIDDADGCPEEDADGDGVADLVDRCPKEPGVHSEDPEKEGCPEHIRRVELEVFLYKQIDFLFASDTVAPSSYPALDEVARLLVANPEIRRLRIEGHTDDKGGERFNLELSRRRANAVRDVLVKRGNVDPKRLISIGFGQSRPIAPNDTVEGRAKNRRVELHIEK